MSSLFFRVPLDEIAYVRAVLEGYDGVANLFSPDPNRGELEWQIGEGLEAEAREIADRLTRECRLIPIARPADWSHRTR